MDESPATRCSLIVKLRDPADSAAWREFVAIYEPLVYRLARRKGLQDADARDLCQDVFQAVARAIDRWDPGRGSFRGWLSRITRNLLINFLTRRQFQPRDRHHQHPGPARGAAGRRPVGDCPLRGRVREVPVPLGGRRDPGGIHSGDMAGVLADRAGGPSAQRGCRRARDVSRGSLRGEKPDSGPPQAADRAA